MAISDLPEVSDGITIPTFDQQMTNVTALVLRKDAVRNPLCGDISRSSRNLSKAIKGANIVTGSEISRVRSHVRKAPATQFSDEVGGVSKLQDDLVSALGSLQNMPSKLSSTLGSVTRLGEHAELMTSNITAVGGMINSAIGLPSRLTSDIAGGFPSSFPAKIPSFSVGPDGLKIPTMSGFSLPEIPKFNLPSVSIPSMPSVANLTGVSVPGIPNPTDVLNSFAGTLNAPDFGGVGKTITSNIASYSAVAAGLAGGVASKISSMASAFDPPTIDTGALTALATPNIEALAGGVGGIADMADMGKATSALTSLGGGASSLVGAEEGAIFGASCSSLAPGGACSSLPSVPAALGQAGGMVQMAKSQASAKLLSSVSTDSLKKQVPNIIG